MDQAILSSSRNDARITFGCMEELFTRIARRASHLSGSAPAFLGAVAIIVIWGISGPFFHYSSTWQLIINTGTTIITFLMVFLIQSSQNHDSVAMQIKLDELIRAQHADGQRAGADRERRCDRL